jgi:hypothetical protein
MYSVKTEVSRFEALWRDVAEMARKDTTEYRDLARLLNYDYPRHFRSYPTRFADGRPAAIPNGAASTDARSCRRAAV